MTMFFQNFVISSIEEKERGKRERRRRGREEGRKEEGLWN